MLLPIAPDEPRKLRQLIERGLQVRLLLMTGGVSMGRYDLVEQVLSRNACRVFFHRSKDSTRSSGRIWPCFVLGAASGVSTEPSRKYFLGLPGNPVSAMVTFELFARPVLEGMAGMSPRPLTFLHARLKSEIRVKPGLRRFLPAILSGQYENSQAELVSWQGSGDVGSIVRSNALIVIPPDREHILPGEWVAVMLR